MTESPYVNKYLTKLHIAFAALLILSSCNNELDLIEEGDPIPVVYALFDMADTAQYVRVEKAFADPVIAADVLAQDPDNLYYENAEVSLTIEGRGTFPLTKVDGNLEGYVRQEGAFAQSPNYLYKIKSDVIDLKRSEKVTLTVRLDEGEPITAETVIVEPAFVVRPNKDALLDFDDLGIVRFSWNSGAEAVIHSMRITFHYSESVNAGPFVDKTIDWNIFRSTDKLRFEFPGKDFYEFLAGALVSDPSIRRIMKSADVLFVSGGQSLSDFSRVSQANLGITSSGEVPVFTNLSRGRGLVGSRATLEYKNLTLSRNTLDRIKNLSTTLPLNFQ